MNPVFYYLQPNGLSADAVHGPLSWALRQAHISATVWKLCCSKNKLCTMLQIWWLCLGLSRELMRHSNRLIEESLIKGPFTKMSRGCRETSRAWSEPQGHQPGAGTLGYKDKGVSDHLQPGRAARWKRAWWQCSLGSKALLTCGDPARGYVPQPFPPSTLQCLDSTHRKPEGQGACGYTLYGAASQDMEWGGWIWRGKWEVSSSRAP